MSSEASTVLERDYQVEIPDDSQNTETTERVEVDNSDWLWKITDFLDIYADEIVECPWQPSVEMTLSDITLQWHVYITPITVENADSVLTQLQQLLANKQQKVEEAPVEELPATAEEEPDLPNSVSQPAEKPKLETSSTKQLNDTPAKPKPAQQIVAPQIATPTPSVSLVAEVEIAANSTYSDSTSYISGSTENITPTPKVESTPIKIEQPRSALPTYPEVQTPSLESISAEAEVAFAVPQITKQAPAPIDMQETDYSPKQVVPLEATVNQVEAIDLKTVETEIAEPLNNAVDETIDSELQVDVVGEPDDSEILIDTVAEPDDFVQAEQILVKVAESVEQCETEIAQKIHEIISQIIDIPTVGYDEKPIDEVQAQEEITALFTELLDTIDISYTPEVLESLVRLTLKGHFALVIENLAELDEDEESQQSNIASKVVQQMITSLAQIKAAINRASAIGRSALRHYGLNLVSSEL